MVIDTGGKKKKKKKTKRTCHSNSEYKRLKYIGEQHILEALCSVRSNTYILWDFKSPDGLSGGKKTFFSPLFFFFCKLGLLVLKNAASIAPWLPYLPDLLKFLRLLVFCYSRWSKFNTLLLRCIFKIYFFLFHVEFITILFLSAAWIKRGAKSTYSLGHYRPQFYNNAEISALLLSVPSIWTYGMPFSQQMWKKYQAFYWAKIFWMKSK